MTTVIVDISERLRRAAAYREAARAVAAAAPQLPLLTTDPSIWLNNDPFSPPQSGGTRDHGDPERAAVIRRAARYADRITLHLTSADEEEDAELEWVDERLGMFWGVVEGIAEGLLERGNMSKRDMVAIVIRHYLLNRTNAT